MPDCTLSRFAEINGVAIEGLSQAIPSRVPRSAFQSDEADPAVVGLSGLATRHGPSGPGSECWPSFLVRLVIIVVVGRAPSGVNKISCLDQSNVAVTVQCVIATVVYR